jgi:hypothetical protein
MHLHSQDIKLAAQPTKALDVSPFESSGGRDQRTIDAMRMQWQFADWESLCAVDVTEHAESPFRAEIAALIGSAAAQLGDLGRAQSALLLAKDWGCPTSLLATLLVSGIHASLAECAASLGNVASASRHWLESASKLGGDARLLSAVREARVAHTQRAKA